MANYCRAVTKSLRGTVTYISISENGFLIFMKFCQNVFSTKIRKKLRKFHFLAADLAKKLILQKIEKTNKHAVLIKGINKDAALLSW
jgi:hypothetical protein